MKRLFVVWSLLFVSFALAGVAQSKTVTREFPESLRPAWMESDAGLKTVVSLDASSKPLRNVLANLSRRYEIHIQAEQALGDYRVTLHAANQPLNKIMGRLQDLFGHGTLSPRSCEWARVVEGARQPTYYLRRTRHGIDEEEALLDVPRQTCLRWLEEMQRYFRLPREEQAKFQAEGLCLRANIRDRSLDGDARPLREAFAALADGQIEKQGAVIDLLAHRPGQASSNPTLMSLETALGLLAQESGLNLYGEVFPRWPIPVDQTKGTPEQLLTLLCARAGYRWRKVGKDVLVYSKSWASDRQANVPQSLLDRWLARFVKNGRYGLLDLLEMARLRDEQVRNLTHWMDVQSALRPLNLGFLRLMGAIAPAELRFAFDPQGQTIGTLDTSSLAFVQKEFKQQANLPIRLFIQSDPDQPFPGSHPDSERGARRSFTVTLQDQSGISKKFFVIEATERTRRLMGPM